MPSSRAGSAVGTETVLLRGTPHKVEMGCSVRVLNQVRMVVAAHPVSIV